MASQKQHMAARKNIKRAARAAKRKETLKRLPKKDAPRTRPASGKEARVTTLSQSTHFRVLAFSTVNFFNNAMLAISFLQWRICVLPAAKFI